MPLHFHDFLRRKFIVINSKLEPYLQRQTCAHELGHALLHKKLGLLFHEMSMVVILIEMRVRKGLLNYACGHIRK